MRGNQTNFRVYKYLSYVSEQAHAQTDEDLELLLNQARENNARLGITGMLIYYEGLYIQFLEGEEKKIEKLYEKIVQDVRHPRILQLDSGYNNERQVGEGSRAFEKLSPKEAQEITGFNELKKKEAFFNTENQEHPAIILLNSYVNNL